MVSVHHEKSTFRGAFFMVKRTRTTRAEKAEKERRETTARRSREGKARRFAEGAPSGFRQIPVYLRHTVTNRIAVIKIILTIHSSGLFSFYG